MGNDVILAKCESIERCLASIRTYYNNDQNSLLDQKTLDAIVLNLQRACQLSVDLAMYIVKILKLGVPKESRDAFEKIFEHNIIDADLHKYLTKMVGFRNIAIHEYKKIDLRIVQKIIETYLDVTFKKFVHVILKYVEKNQDL